MVRLEEPERGERRFVAPAAIPIEARADAARGRTIVKVEFFAENQLIGQATATPYETVWTQVPEGQYRLRARATDDRGASGWSAPILVRVRENREPRVRLLAPQPGQSYAAPAAIEFEAQARDRDHNLARVEFYANGVLVGTDASPRFRFSWIGVAAGTYNVMARAVDALGATDDSNTASIVVTGNQAPTVDLTSPADNASYAAPASITLVAQVEDSDGIVTQVEFFDGQTLVGTLTTPPYTITMNSVPAGNYSFTARATDDLGASSTSAAANVTVNATVAQIYYIHVDHLNTPRLVADATGTTVWRWDQQEPFGNTLPDENPSGLGAFDLPLRLPGQRYDAETGLHYNYFRDYDPSLGRYAESDLIGLRGGINTYAYVGSDPLHGVDPLGLVKFCCRPVADGWALGSKHCWIVADDGTRYSLFPEAIGGRRIGVPRTGDERDRDGDCVDCPKRECSPDRNTCIRDAHNSYPRGTYVAWPGPNSNTYAGALARQCCEGGVPSGIGWAPGVDMAPPRR